MSAPEFARMSAAIAFALAMLALGTLNPNGALGSVGCGLVCDGSPIAGTVGR